MRFQVKCPSEKDKTKQFNKTIQMDKTTQMNETILINLTIKKKFKKKYT